VPARSFIALLASVAVLLAGCGGDEEPSDDSAVRAIAGNWTGDLEQQGLAPFRIAVRIEPSGNGEVAYTGIRCGGRWSLDKVVTSRPPQYEFTERIDRGAGGECKGSGRVDIEPDSVDPHSGLHYEFTGGGVSSRGLLGRTDLAGLNSVFAAAGLSPP
jgi:hypothetical protein